MPYIPHTSQDIKEMLSVIGVPSIEALLSCIPEKIRFNGSFNIPEGACEIELERLMTGLAERNKGLDTHPCFMGAGYYDHFVPVLVDFLTSRSEFWTAYTPYQPEVSQGMLQSIFEYQTMICELTGMDISNASLYDGASAAAEACMMALSNTSKGKKVLVLTETIHPEYRQVIETYLSDLDITFRLVPSKDGKTDINAIENAIKSDTFGVILQTPNFFGIIEDAPEITQRVHKLDATMIVITDPISLGILKAPGDYGADIAVGDGLGLGSYLSFGGPSLGFLGCKEKFLRKMPGRIIGQTVDGRGERGFVLTLQTREQHIRREKATSNICTNEALIALRATIFMATLGKVGFFEMADASLQKAHYLASRIEEIEGYSLPYKNEPFFCEFVVRCPKDGEEILRKVAEHGIYGGVSLSNWFKEQDNDILIAVTEKRTRKEMDELVLALKEARL